MRLIRLRSARRSDIPRRPGELRLLNVPPRLRIPLLPGPDGDLVPLPPGTFVTKGQPLTQPSLSPSQFSNLKSQISPLAPASARILGLCHVTLLNGRAVPAIELETQPETRAASAIRQPLHPHELRQTLSDIERLQPADLPAWLDRLRSGGVWADRAGCPDLLAQLTASPAARLDTVICSLLDSQPSLPLAATLLARWGLTLLAGVRLLARLSGARNAWIVVGAGTPARWWGPLNRLGRRSRTAIIPIDNDYPQSNPTLLLQALLHRRLPPGRLPVERGAIVLDGPAAWALGLRAARDQPMLDVPMAVEDHFSGRRHLLRVPVGSSVAEVLRQCSVAPGPMTILRGHPLQENSVAPDSVVSGGEVTLHALPESVPTAADPCIRCGWCIESCPTAVQPAGLLDAAQRADPDLARRWGLDRCIECGLCAYVCPSHLPLLQAIRTLKALPFS